MALKRALVEQTYKLGVLVHGSDATIEATVVRSTLPNAHGDFGRGLSIQDNPATNAPSNATVRGCLVEQNHDAGVMIVGTDATIVDSAVRDTAPNSDNTFGDGISVILGDVKIQGVEVTQNARAGVASFGGQVVITGSVITCNGFDLEGEPYNSVPFSFDGSTGWQCSDKLPVECTKLGAGHVETSAIEAPSELPPVDPLPLAGPTPP